MPSGYINPSLHARGLHARESVGTLNYRLESRYMGSAIGGLEPSSFHGVLILVLDAEPLSFSFDLS